MRRLRQIPLVVRIARTSAAGRSREGQQKR
jgi:hypothetical protein